MIFLWTVQDLKIKTVDVKDLKIKEVKFHPNEESSSHTKEERCIDSNFLCFRLLYLIFYMNQEELGVSARKSCESFTTFHKL